MDLLSGSWPGELFFFKGGQGRSFAAPEMLRDKTGEIINVGGGIQERPGEGILIRGSVDWEQTDEGTFITYRGKRMESTPEKSISSTGTASTVHVADFDGDGDQDLIVGNIDGDVYLIPNEGTATAYAFGKETRLQAGGRPLRVGGRAGPYAADWDGDGDLDLLIGEESGSVSLFRNTGSAKSPEWAAGVQLVPPGRVEYGSQAPTQPQRGNRSKICVADWNGDGRPDLLVGDYATLKPDRPDPTPEEQARYDQIRKDLEPLQKRFGELIQKLQGDDRPKTKEEQKQLYDNLNEVSRQMSPLRSQLPQEFEAHGWVWLFLRK
jgi:hypothetical protein